MSAREEQAAAEEMSGIREDLMSPADGNGPPSPFFPAPAGHAAHLFFLAVPFFFLWPCATRTSSSGRR